LALIAEGAAAELGSDDDRRLAAAKKLAAEGYFWICHYLPLFCCPKNNLFN